MQRDPIDAGRAIDQHREYENLIRRLGARLISLPPQPDMADSVFVEDTAFVVDEVAIIASMGTNQRRRETDAIADALAPHRELVHIAPSARIEGGDLFRVGRRVFAGRSTRTDDAGIAALVDVLRPFDYEVVPVDVLGCLHLTTGAAPVSDDAILINPRWVDADAFGSLERIEVDPCEPWAGNVLRVGDALVMPKEFPKTRRRLAQRGLDVHTIDISELMKAEAGLTCMSLLFESDAGPA